MIEDEEGVTIEWSIVRRPPVSPVVSPIESPIEYPFESPVVPPWG